MIRPYTSGDNLAIISPDSSVFAGRTWGSIVLWDTATCALLAEIPVRARIMEFVISATNDQLAVRTPDFIVLVPLPPEPNRRLELDVGATDIAISHTGSYVAAIVNDNPRPASAVLVYHTDSGVLYYKTALCAYAQKPCFSSFNDSLTAVSTYTHHFPGTHDWRRGAVLVTSTRHHWLVAHRDTLRYATVARHYAVTCDAHTVEVWSLAGESYHTLCPGSREITSAALSTDGLSVSVSTDDAITTWCLESGVVTAFYVMPLRQLLLSGNPKIAYSCKDGITMVWRTPRPNGATKLVCFDVCARPGGWGRLRCVSLLASADGSVFAGCAEGGWRIVRPPDADQCVMAVILAAHRRGKLAGLLPPEVWRTVVDTTTIII